MTTTIEKLFVQLFERKCHVINQANRQADTYSHYLASKLLIHGIAPPPSLWNPNFDPKEFNKEELLSELLLPHPRPTVTNRGGLCSLYNQSLVLEGNEGVEARIFGGINVSNEGFGMEHGQAFVSDANNEGIGSALNVPELDVNTSLQGKSVIRSSNIITGSANEEAPKGFSFEAIVPNRSRHTEDNSTPHPEFNHNDVVSILGFTPELDQSIISPLGKNETKISSNIAAREQSLSRIQRSKSRQKALELRKTAEKAVKTNQTDTNVSVVCYSGDKIFSNASNHQQPHQEGESSALAKNYETPSHVHVDALALGECLSKEKDANITRSRNSCNLFTDDSKSKLDTALDDAEVEGCRSIRSQDNCVEGIQKDVHLSNASSQRVTRSKSGPSGKLPLNYSDGREECQNQNAPSSEFILRSPVSNNSSEQKEKVDCIIAAKVIVDGSVESQAACSQSKLDVAGPRVGSENCVSKPSSNCRMNVEPKTLEFDEMEKISLIEVNSPTVERETLNKSLKKRCESAESHASMGKVNGSNCSRRSLEKQLHGEEIPNQITEPWKDSSETSLEMHTIVDEHVTSSSTSKIVEDNSDVDGKIHSSPIPHGEQIRSSGAGEDVDGKIHNLPIPHGEQIRSTNIGEDVDTLVHQKKEESNSISNQPVLKCDLSCNQMVRGDATTVSSFVENSNVCQVSSSRRTEANDESISTPDATKYHVEEDQNMKSLESVIDGALTSTSSVLLHEKSSLRGDGFLACDAVESCFDNGFTSDEIRELKILEEESMQRRKLRSVAENTWPQLKRRKIESQETNSIPAAFSFRLKENHDIRGGSYYRNLNSTGPYLGHALQFENSPSSHEEDAAQSSASKSPDVELHPEILAQETKSLTEMPIEQDELDFAEKSRCKSPLNVQDGECMSFTASSLSIGDAEFCFGLNAKTDDATSTVLDERPQGFEKDYNDLVHFENDDPLQNKDDLARYGITPMETKPCAVEDGFHPSFSAPSPQDNHLTTSSSDRTMPEFEGFIIGEEDSGQRHIVGEAFDHLDLPTSSVERASVLEQLCKSAVMHTPIYQFSATRKFHRTPDVYHSVPAFNLNDDGFKKLGANYSSVDDVKGASQGLYPDRIPFSDALYGQSLTIPPTSPVSKLWGRISSQSFSSERKLSSNPELTCFPIEEDPIFSEEQEDKDEVGNSIEEEICSTSMYCDDKRNPLADITQAIVNPPLSIDASKEFRDISSLDPVDTEISFTETHGGVQQKLGKHHSSKRIGTNETKKKLTLSSSTSFMGIGKESLDNGFSKPNLSRKTSLRNGGQCMSGRKSKHNNIISNISSFVPFVQQKQAAAVITGKRDVKVKALEVAEAAKRLEEKKENERKLKKEVVKLERARLEQENLRQAEINRKKKEAELKKKEADVAARKRLREEEEKKERERKRRRFEGKRQQQKEKEEKLCARKLEKEFPVGVIDAKLNSGAVNADALRKPQRVKVDMDKGGKNNVKKPETEFAVSKSSENDVRQAVLEGFEAFGHSRVSREVTNTSRGKSYEMSPYQSSDNEDDEDDEVSPKKFVPTWASKESLALVASSQQDVDPDILFDLETFQSVDEVSGLGVYKKK